MRILHVLPFHLERRALGGVHTYALGLAQAQLCEGHRVSMCAPGVRVRPYEREAGPTIYELGPRMRFGVTPTMPLSIIHVIVRERPDIVHVHGTFNFISDGSIFLCGGLGVPVVQSPHGSLLRSELQEKGGRAKRAYTETILSRAHRIAVQHYLTPHEQRESLEFPWTRSAVAFAGLTVPIDSEAPVRSVPTKGGLLEHKNYFLYLARVTRQKGYDLLVDAYRRFIRENPEESVPPLVVAGAPEAPELLDLAHRGGNAWDESGKILYLGPVEDQDRKWRLIRGARLLLAPSRWESFGYSVIEAGMVGTPVAFGTGGLMSGEWAEAGATMPLETKREEEFYSTLASVLHLSQEQLAEAGIRAARYFRETYAWSRRVSSLDELYRSAITHVR